MSDIPKTREYARAAAHPIRHIGEASHPERGALDCVLRSTADAMRDELIARIINLEAALAAKTNELSRSLTLQGEHLLAIGAMEDSQNQMLRDLQRAEAALAERDRESTDLLTAIFDTVDPEDGEEIVAEAFPKGGPAWVLVWYREHPNEEEIAARAEAGSGG